MTLSSKQWMIRLFLTTIIVTGLPVAGIMGFNYWMDPLWNFSHSHEYNDYQIGFDERQQKTNYINSRPFEYDSLLIGTSRVTYMDEHQFKKDKVFNYSLSALHIDEYLPYIQYTTEKNGEDFDKIYMELYYNSYNADEKNTHNDPSTYFNKAEQFLYKYTSLFSKGTYDNSMDNLEISKKNEYSGPRSYTRDNVALTSYPNDRLSVLWERYKTSFEATSKTAFNYDEHYKEKLIELKQAYPDTEFVIFTDMVPDKRLQLILSNPSEAAAFERWYGEMVDVFGEIDSFHGSNRLTTDLDYWFDWFHYYPEVGEEMIRALENPEDNEDIMTTVNRNNLTDFLQGLKK